MVPILLSLAIDLHPIQSLNFVALDTMPHRLVLAEAFVENVDVLGPMGDAWNSFIQSGRAATFAIGLVLGYSIRSMTA